MLVSEIAWQWDNYFMSNKFPDILLLLETKQHVSFNLLVIKYLPFFNLFFCPTWRICRMQLLT